MSKNLNCKACGQKLVAMNETSDKMLLGCNSHYCNMANVNVTGSIFGNGKIEIFGQSKTLDFDSLATLGERESLWFSMAEAILSDFWDCKVENVTFDLFK